MAQFDQDATTGQRASEIKLPLPLGSGGLQALPLLTVPLLLFVPFPLAFLAEADVLFYVHKITLSHFLPIPFHSNLFCFAKEKSI